MMLIKISLAFLALAFADATQKGNGNNGQTDKNRQWDSGSDGKTCIVKPSNSSLIDDAPAIVKAFDECGQNGKVIFLNTTYYVNTVMNTTGLKNCDVDLRGTLIWSTNTTYWLSASLDVGYQNQSSAWIFGGENINFQAHGYGTFNGNGQIWSTFASGVSNYPRRPHAITITNTKDSIFEGIIFYKSQMWTMTVIHSSNILLQDIIVNNVVTRNTDGANTIYSDHITFNRWSVTNGDDSIAIKANSTDISITNSVFTSGLGLAFGSIGQYKGAYETIENVVATNITCSKTLHAAYIKTWTGQQVGYPPNGGGGGLGLLKNVQLTNFTVSALRGFPFSITQCTTFSGVAGDCNTSLFQLSSISFENMIGSTVTAVSGVEAWAERPPDSRGVVSFKTRIHRAFHLLYRCRRSLYHPKMATVDPQCLDTRDDICFHHPGYRISNLLLTLPRVDSTVVADTTPAYGVHHRTALLACQIIAGNAFNNSRFAVDREGRQLVQVPLDGVLTDSQYYFIVDGSSKVFPSSLLTILAKSSAAAASSTTTCGITNTNYAIDGAYLVPQKERTWYEDNNMSRYGVGLPNIDNRVNILPLRKDIHYCFDNRWFVIIPKITKVETGSATPSIQYITYIISREAAEIWPIYHNALVKSLHNSSRAYLFARFAWAILFRVKSFIISGRPRHVIRIHKDEEGEIEYKAEHLTGIMLSSRYGGGGSQAATPKKRKFEPGSAANDEENPIESSSEDSDMEMDGLWDVIDWEGRRQRRQRRQDPSDETVPDDKVHLASDIEADLREALRKGMQQTGEDPQADDEVQYYH
ncbi:hypothetical protein G7Y89_g7047 [Cudoniella acicularis]|uniref:HNH nuclease domain-containing protein n=1 Tax=Cudoniella acicularis TaxID=354080 RepID=A0A8H4RMS8_9HELO|nr:hypothetical protein G7Y89_g7047 [Cudoniella acicularis]